MEREHAMAGDFKSMAALIDNHSLSPDDPDEHGNAPLMLAAASGKLEMIGYLSLGSSFQNRKAALNAAAKNGHRDVVKVLLPNPTVDAAPSWRVVAASDQQPHVPVHWFRTAAEQGDASAQF